MTLDGYIPIHLEPPREGSPMPKRHPATEAMLRWFACDHLPPHLQEISIPIRDLAVELADTLPSDPELTVGLRKLLEAKDCFVRARLAGKVPGHSSDCAVHNSPAYDPGRCDCG